ncbi:uncharacterized protein cd79b [Anoplopoma fimbria]|uniref:uncharacterized protein cd79b n=1 Tax=Anoplopoma fimbria TaxID=229290 RepID=UPI0023EB648C|nr:uncharacterized protein cd79b [Anoplopoma fimbria]
MRWLLAGCCGLALINISVAPNPAVQITQKPRFYGLKARTNLFFCCLSSQNVRSADVKWFKTDRYDDEDVKSRRPLVAGRGFEYHNENPKQMFLVLHDVRIEDKGVYFCKVNETWGPGTALQVAKPIDLTRALYRTQMKDGLIILQGLLMAVCIAAVLLRKQKLYEKQDSIYEEPETDHIYEGLAIETCGGGLYEELSVYAQADVAEGAEAPWE